MNYIAKFVKKLYNVRGGVNMKKYILFIVLIFILLSACGSTGGTNEHERAAAVFDFRGNVKTARDSDVFDIFRNMALVRQDTIVTYDDSWVILALTEERFALIEEHSVVQVSNLADAAARETGLILLNGKVWVHIYDDSNENFEIIIHGVTFGVRGTTFAVDMSNPGDVTLLVFDGVVEAMVETPDGVIPYNVPAGRRLAVQRDETGVPAAVQAALTFEDAEPLFRRGGAGPGGAYDILRETLSDFVWDENNNLFNIDMPVRAPVSVSLSRSPLNVGSVRGEGVYNAGDNIWVSALVNTAFSARYVFDGWYEHGVRVSRDEVYHFTITSDRELQARFTEITAPVHTPEPYVTRSYNINVTAQTGGRASGAGRFAEGSTVTLWAAADPGFIFEGWSENGRIINNHINFSFPAQSDRTLTALFIRQRVEFTINAHAGFGGVTAGGGRYGQGSGVTLQASPNHGFTFDGWFENGIRINNNPIFTFTAESNRTLEARFTEDIIDVHITASVWHRGGRAAGGGVYRQGERVTLTATPDRGFTFDGWFENNVRVSNNPTYNFTAQTNRTLEARFSEERFRVLINVTAGQGGHVTGGGWYEQGDWVRLEAFPDIRNGYWFAGWYDGNLLISENNVLNLTAGLDMPVLRAEFRRQWQWHH